MNSILLFTMGLWEWVILLLIIIVLFGARKIPGLAKGFGKGIRLFKEELDSKKEDNKENN